MEMPATAHSAMHISVTSALTGEIIAELDMSPGDSVGGADSGAVAQWREELGGAPAGAGDASVRPRERLLSNGVLLGPDLRLAEAGLEDGSHVQAVSCQYQAVATASYDKSVRIWSAGTGECERILEGHGGYVHTVCFSPDGSILASGSHDKMVKLWSTSTWQCERTLDGHQSYVRAVNFSPDSKSLVSGSGDCNAMVWDVATGSARFWEIKYGDYVRTQRTLQGHMSSVNSASFAPDGNRIVTGSEDRTAKIWDVETGLCSATLKGHASHAYASFAPDGESVVTGSDDKTVKIWDLEGRCLLTLEGHSKWVRSASFAPDMSAIATASGDRTARTWDAKTGECLLTFHGHESFLYSVSFSADGAYIVTSSGDNTARIWDVATGECLQVLSGHTKQLCSAAFGPLSQ